MMDGSYTWLSTLRIKDEAEWLFDRNAQVRSCVESVIRPFQHVQRIDKCEFLNRSVRLAWLVGKRSSLSDAIQALMVGSIAANAIQNYEERKLGREKVLRRPDIPCVDCSCVVFEKKDHRCTVCGRLKHELVPKQDVEHKSLTMRLNSAWMAFFDAT